MAQLELLDEKQESSTTVEAMPIDHLRKDVSDSVVQANHIESGKDVMSDNVQTKWLGS